MVALNPDLMRRARATKLALQREGTVRAVYLFGSHVDGRANEWSDIDVAVFIDEVDSWGVWRRAEVAARVQEKVGYDIEPHLFSGAALAAPERGSFVEYILNHGVPVE